MKAFRALFAFNYVQNGWLGDVFSSVHEDVHYLKAQVSPSQPGVGRKDYQAWVSFSGDGTVLTGSCTCPAGLGRSCSHMSALIYAVTQAWTHGIAGSTCTDLPVAWGRRSAQMLKPEKLGNINFSRPKHDGLPVIPESSTAGSSTQKMPPVGQFLDHKDLQKHIEKSDACLLWNTKGTMLQKILTAPERPVSGTVPLTHTDHNIGENIPMIVQCSPCNDFYSKYVKLSTSQRQQLHNLTVGQNTQTWTDSRKIRITASVVSSVPKTNRADPNKFVNNQIYPRFKGCTATKHGQKFEGTARKCFEEREHKTVSLSGIFVSESAPYLAASPDGIIDDNTILEIKCPTKPLSQLIQSGKYDVIMEDDQAKLNPKGKNHYYHQVQFAMFCSKAKLCKFFVWTKDEQILVDVHYDNDFVMSMLPRLRNFYFQHCLVRIADEFHFRRLQFCESYKRICA